VSYNTDYFIFEKLSVLIMGKTTKELNRVINLTLERCYRELFTKKDKISLSVEISDLRKRESIWGSASPDGKNEFTVELDGFSSLYQTIHTLCHEMVHVNQYYRGDLKSDSAGFYWLGIDMSDVAYCRQPWEKEAYTRQKSLAQMVFDEQMCWSKKRAQTIMARNGEPIKEDTTNNVISLEEFLNEQSNSMA